MKQQYNIYVDPPLETPNQDLLNKSEDRPEHGGHHETTVPNYMANNIHHDVPVCTLDSFSTLHVGGQLSARKKILYGEGL